jgi:rod shape-determining protein MreC
MFDFLRRYQVLVSSGILLLLAAMLISANDRREERVDPFGRFVLEAIYPLQLVVSQITGGGYSIWHNYVQLVGVRAEADALRARVAVLEGELTSLAEVEAANLRLRRLLEFRRTIDERLVAARVIGSDASARERTITLDKGERDGVARGAAVLVPEGVVGHVFSTSPGAARVLLISDRNSGVDTIVQRTRVRGIAEGGEGVCNLKYVKRGADVREGDHVVTSGLDGIFPKGVLLGDVVQVDTPKQGMFQTIVIEPRVVFDQLEEVLVTTRQKPDQQIEPSTERPVNGPTDELTHEATGEPTGGRTDEPTDEPTGEPTGGRTDEPTDEPTGEQSGGRTDEPTDGPTGEPIDDPSEEPPPGGGEVKVGLGFLPTLAVVEQVERRLDQPRAAREKRLWG